MDDTAQRVEWVAGLHQLANFVEAHPDLSLPSLGSHIYIWGVDAETTKVELARLARILAPVAKSADDYWFKLAKSFGPHVLEVLVNREAVCQRVVVGTKTETHLVPPEGVEMIEVTETVDIIEWICPPSILAPADEQTAVAS